MKICVLPLISFSLLSGCANLSLPSENPYFNKSSPENELSLIKALNGDERLHKGNPFNPFNKANWRTTITGVQDFSEPKMIDGEWAGMLVRPGGYNVRILCIGNGFSIWGTHSLPNLKPGYKYSFECYGATANGMKIIFHEPVNNEYVTRTPNKSLKQDK